MMLTDEQRAMRRTGVTATDIAALLGLSPWRTPLQVWCAKMGAEPEDTSDDIERGTFLETGARQWYAHRTGNSVVEVGTLRHPSRPVILATPDGLVTTRDGEGRTLEIKMPSRRTGWGEAGTDEIPPHYVYQVAFQLAVTAHDGRTVADVFTVLDGKPILFHVRRDEELEAMLLDAAERFWVDHVLPRRPPPVTEPLRDVEAAGSLYPRHAGDARQWDALSTPEQVCVREYLQARQERKRAQALEAAWEARLKMALGTTPRLEGLPPDTGAKALTWRQNKPGKVTDWEAIAAHLGNRVSLAEYKEALEQHTTTKDGARPLRVSEREDEE